MKAIVCTKYGPPEVLKLMDVEQPVPQDNELLIRIRATSAHVGDTKIRRCQPGRGPVRDFFFKPFMRLMLGFRGPRSRILGMDLAGEIADTGKDVKTFEKGDEVFASAFAKFKFGAYAEYICLPEDGLVARKPSNMTFEEAAPVTNGALTALLILRKAAIQPGHKVLIYGASGSLGTYSVQLAKHHGAKVTGVCSTANLELVQSLGADQVIDYTRESVAESGERYHVVFDSVAKMPADHRKSCLQENGIYLDALRSSDGLKFSAADLDHLRELCEAGVLKTVIDRTFRLDEMVEAHRYVDSGRKKGNVVIKV